MTIIRALTLRNLLILLCAAVFILIGVKGYEINRKIHTLDEAERMYAKKDLLRAEELYQQAKSNKAIRYHEAAIAAKLRELQPITLMKQSLGELDKRIERAGRQSNFTSFMEVYSDLQAVQLRYMSSGGLYATYYPKISAAYDLSKDITQYFQQFKAFYYNQMQDALSKGTYTDDTFKWNLLRIPDVFYGSAEQKSKQLEAKFQSYDEAVLARLAAEGKFSAMLEQSAVMLNSYKSQNIKANWVAAQDEKLTRTLLEKDIDGESPANFAAHARAYSTFVAAAGYTSKVQPWIERQISTWMKTAKRKIKKADFPAAIQIYEALASYRDTTEDIKAANLAWTIHDPIRLLQSSDSSRTYSQVSGGSGDFGGKAYALGADEQNIIYFAKMNNDDQTQIMSSQDYPKDIAIQQISLEKSLSTNLTPVILIKAASTVRKSLFTAYEVQQDRMVQIFQFAADSYQVQPDKTLLVTNPEGDVNTQQQAIYTRTADHYEFTGYPKDYTEILVKDLLGHANEKVRFSCYATVVGMSEGTALAEMGDSYVLLRGNVVFTEGMNTVTGIFTTFEEIYLNGDQTTEPVSVPVFEVEKLE
ncbi:hypothetical protein [Paenibacillus pini]|uniref:Uncharacterized protein n=1 Tax=Paenibacillus pini JCM 16418 TaxID=1236976 RepID=W7YYU0_9BACL|nr:hypothetical protein [Paenibacillus pini]GAF09801.1 hypothetical protein JCM16418_3957 [Paenibacillus pini JCM 16418]